MVLLNGQSNVGMGRCSHYSLEGRNEKAISSHMSVQGEWMQFINLAVTTLTNAGEVGGQYQNSTIVRGASAVAPDKLG